MVKLAPPAIARAPSGLCSVCGTSKPTTELVVLGLTVYCLDCAKNARGEGYRCATCGEIEPFDSRNVINGRFFCGSCASIGLKNTTACRPDPDPVNHPQHYTDHPSGIECIQITEHMGFCLGNAVKYIWRADLKGNAIEDLEKARWYLDREIARRKGGDA